MISMYHHDTLIALLQDGESATTDGMPKRPPQQILTAQQCRAARAGLLLAAGDLAKEAGVARMTVSRFETGQTELIAATAKALRDALEARGVRFPNLKSVIFPD
jgi:DNA-binding XRE family transcriptional regulator